MGYNTDMMRVISGNDTCVDQDVVLSIGAFDGVHCGHQALLRALTQRARERAMLSAVLTFHPHPREVLQPGVQLRYLTTDAERARLFEALGIDLLMLQPFDRDLAATTAREFLVRLREQFRMRELWAGPDFALGRDKQGNVARLYRLAGEVGYELRVVPRVSEGDQAISSTRIRGLLEEGAVASVTELLGRQYGVSGVVRYGAQRGRRLGFRTANLRLGPLCACPGDGVYAVWGQIADGWHPGVANLGRRPSFDLGERLLEVHLLDFQGSLYGEHMRVLFVERLRGERRFEDADQLVAQVGHDMDLARTILSTIPPMDLTLCGDLAIAS
jgi:riboflavin kinase/FMN adenylyltransferase